MFMASEACGKYVRWNMIFSFLNDLDSDCDGDTPSSDYSHLHPSHESSTDEHRRQSLASQVNGLSMTRQLHHTVKHRQ